MESFMEEAKAWIVPYSQRKNYSKAEDKKVMLNLWRFETSNWYEINNKKLLDPWK
jgi:hypothetical protein